MGCQRLVGSLKHQVSFAKELYKKGLFFKRAHAIEGANTSLHQQSLEACNKQFTHMQPAIHSHATSNSLAPSFPLSHFLTRPVVVSVRQDMVSRVEIAAERAVGAFSSTVGIFSIVFLAVLVRLVLFVPHLPAD